MLAALLLAGIVAAPLGSAGLFAGARPHAHVTGPWPAARRLVLALIGTAVLAAAAAVVLRLLHATEHNLIAGAAVVVVASLIWLPVTRRWRARAHLCWVVSQASVLGLFARKAAFLRTPKTSEQAKWWEALRANWAETTLAVLGLAGIIAALTKVTQLSGPLLAVLLLFPTLGMAAAPFNSWAAQRAALPAWLRDRRRTEYRRDRSANVAGAATGGLVVVLGVVAAVMFLLLAPTHHLVQPPSLLGPAQGSHTSSPAPSRSSSPARTSTPATPTPSTSSASTTPSAVPSPTVSVTPSATASASATTPTGTATPTP